MENNLFLSFIIIVYNTELNLLERCLNSVIENAPQNSEIIVVDDGSTCRGIKELCTSKNIKYIYKQNGGSGSARNVGIKNSNGKYIAFIDSDDYLKENIFDKLQNEHINEDIIFLDYFIDNNDNIQYDKLLMNEIDDLSMKKKDIIKCLLGDYTLFHGYTMGAIWNKMFKKDFLCKNELLFNENIPKGQDILFVIKCLLCSPSITYKNIASYVYFINQESICHKPNEKLMQYYKIFLDNLGIISQEISDLNILSKDTIELCYRKASLNCVYLALLANVFNPNINKSIKERKVEFNNVYTTMREYLKFNIFTLNCFTNSKEKIKFLLLKYKLFYILYIYEKVKYR